MKDPKQAEPRSVEELEQAMFTHKFYCKRPFHADCPEWRHLKQKWKKAGGEIPRGWEEA